MYLCVQTAVNEILSDDFTIYMYLGLSHGGIFSISHCFNTISTLCGLYLSLHLLQLLPSSQRLLPLKIHTRKLRPTISGNIPVPSYRHMIKDECKDIFSVTFSALKCAMGC